MTVLRARVLSPEGPDSVCWLPDARVAFDRDGIIDVSAWTGGTCDEDVREGHVLVPGFVDTHIHFPQTRIVGEATGPLLTWLQRSTFPEEARFADPEHANAVAELFTRALLRAGTTTALVYGSVHADATHSLFRAAERVGIQMLAGPVWMDEGCPDALRVPTEEAVEAVETLVARWHRPGGRRQVAVIPRFALSCSAPMLAAAGALAREHDLFVSTHLAETPDECALAMHRAGTDDYLAVYEAAGLIGPKTVLAHCIWLSDGEWDRLALAGAAVAHCPDSNAFLGSGGMRLGEALRRHVPIGLGSDVAAGRSFRIGLAAAHAWDNARRQQVDVDPRRLFWWATAGGARVLGLHGSGRLAFAQSADFSLRPMPPWADSEDRVLAQLLFDADAPPPARVWTEGQLRWQDDGNPWWRVVS